MRYDSPDDGRTTPPDRDMEQSVFNVPAREMLTADEKKQSFPIRLDVPEKDAYETTETPGVNNPAEGSKMDDEAHISEFSDVPGSKKLAEAPESDIVRFEKACEKDADAEELRATETPVDAVIKMTEAEELTRMHCPSTDVSWLTEVREPE